MFDVSMVYGEHNDYILLTKEGKPFITCFLSQDNKSIQHIDFGEYNDGDRYIVREYFENYLLTHEKDKKEIVEKLKKPDESMEQVIMKKWRELQAMIAVVQEKENEVQNDIEWNYKIVHHYQQPMKEMIQRYLDLSYEEKKATQQELLHVMEDVEASLVSHLKELEKQNSDILRKQIELLKKRIEIKS